MPSRKTLKKMYGPAVESLLMSVYTYSGGRLVSQKGRVFQHKTVCEKTVPVAEATARFSQLQTTACCNPRSVM